MQILAAYIHVQKNNLTCLKKTLYMDFTRSIHHSGIFMSNKKKTGIVVPAFF